MVSISVKYSGNRFVEIKAKGHAYKGIYGKDIVCAAISSLMNSLHVGLANVMLKDPKTKAGDGELTIQMEDRLTDPESDCVNFLVETILRSIEMIGKEYNLRVEIRRENV